MDLVKSFIIRLLFCRFPQDAKNDRRADKPVDHRKGNGQHGYAGRPLIDRRARLVMREELRKPKQGAEKDFRPKRQD
ncbi:MAG: hypothetical protein AB2653_15090 [Candidatus Thiodiazotropha endolucinida]